MKKLKSIIWVMIVLFVASCGENDGLREEDNIANKEAIEDDNIQKDVLDSDLNLDEYKDKKFIQTADIKYKVKDVFETTMTIEDVVSRHKGFIIYTNLQNRIQEVKSHQITSDSSLEITYYTMENQLRVRVPSGNLQKFLRELNQTVAFPNHRIVEAKDVSLGILGKELEQKRLESFGNKTENMNLVDSLKPVQNMALLENQTNIDESILAQKEMEEQIKFSTIEMYIYQNPKITKEMIAIVPSNYPKYEPAFSTQIKDALYIALSICKYILLIVVAISPFVLIGLLFYIIYKNKKRWKLN